MEEIPEKERIAWRNFWNKSEGRKWLARLEAQREGVMKRALSSMTNTEDARQADAEALHSICEAHGMDTLINYIKTTSKK